MRSQQDGAALRVFTSLAEIIMIRQGRDAIDPCKARPVKHLHQAALARVTRHLRKTLVVLPRLLAQKQGTALFRQAHTFEEQTFFCDSVKVSNGLQRILQVVEQAKTEHEIKLSQLGNLPGFHVCLFKRNAWKAPARFLDVFRARVKAANAQTAFRKRLREEANAASCVHGVRKAQGGLQPL